jgi:hypothetical protein
VGRLEDTLRAKNERFKINAALSFSFPPNFPKEMFSRSNRYEPVATGGGQPIPAPAQPRRRLLQMVFGLFAVIGVFVAVVLTREGAAVESYQPVGG